MKRKLDEADSTQDAASNKRKNSSATLLSPYGEEKATLPDILTSEFWLGVAPLLHCCNESYWATTAAVHPMTENRSELQQTRRRRLLTDGYCYLSADSDMSDIVGRIAEAMEQLVRQHEPTKS